MDMPIKMTTTTPLTEKELAMFLGCECEAETANGKIITDISIDTLRLVQEYGRTIKPILTRLEDMSREHRVLVNNYHYTINEKHEYAQYALITKWQIEHRYDIFNWIDAGKAIDKKTLKN